MVFINLRMKLKYKNIIKLSNLKMFNNSFTAHNNLPLNSNVNLYLFYNYLKKHKTPFFLISNLSFFSYLNNNFLSLYFRF